MPLLPIEETQQEIQPGSGLVSLGGENRTPIQSALDQATEEIAAAGSNLAAGAVESGAILDLLSANAFMLLDRASEILSETTGLSKGDAFKRAERFYRAESSQLLKQAERLGGEGVSSRALQIIGGLPANVAAAGASAVAAGPVIGFAGLGALSEADKGLLASALGALEGATIGQIFKSATPLTRPQRAATLATAGTALPLARGVEPKEAALSGATLGTLAALGKTPRRAVRLREEVKIEKEAVEPRPTEKPVVEGSKPRPVTEEVAAEPAQEKPAEPLVTEEAEPLVRVTPRTEEAAREFLGRDYSELEIPDKAVNLNLKRIKGPDDFKRAVSELVEIYKPEINEARRGTITREQTQQMADDLGLSLEQFLSKRKGTALNAEEITANRVMTRTVLEEWKASADRVKSGQATDQDKAEFLRLTGLAEASLQSTLGATAEAGRALSALAIEAGPSASQMRGIREAIQGFRGGKGQDLETFADMVSEIDNPEGLARFALESRKATTSEKLIEVWINSLLSGPQTHAVNTLSNELVSYYTIPETYLAGAIGALRTTARVAIGKKPVEDRVYFREGGARLFGIVQSAKEGLTIAAKVFRTGEPTDPLSKIETQRFRAIGGVKGEIIRIPGRALIAADEFYKIRARRQELNALAMRDGIESGKSGRDLAQHIVDFLRDPPESAQEASILFARRQTFTDPLGVSGRGAQKLFSRPLGKLVQPFVRVMTNIFKFSLRRSPPPFSLALEDVRADLKAGGARRDEAIARMAFSTAVGAWVASEAAIGNITGSGPSDPELRRAWLLRNRPYSFRIPARAVQKIEEATGVSIGVGERAEATGDLFLSFTRLEPIGTIFGVAADYAEISGHIKERGSEDIASKIAMSISKNIASKTFMQGLSNVALTLSDPDRYGDRFVQRLAGTVIPTGVAQLARTRDPILRDVRSTIDQIKSRLPGYSSELLPRRNIWGEPIFLGGGLGPDIVSPIYSSRVVPDKASEEVIRLKVKLPALKRTVSDVELTPREYDALVKKTGELAKRTIGDMVSSVVWDKIPDGLKREMLEKEYAFARRDARDAFMKLLLEKAPGRVIEVERRKLEESGLIPVRANP